MSEHSLLSPSGSHCWVHCTASVKAVEEAKQEGIIPEETETSYSKEGTLAHDLAKDILYGFEFVSDIPEDMQEPMQSYIDLARQITKPEDKTGIETKVPIFYKPEDNCTIDYYAYSEKRFYILDLKWGQGVLVAAKDNTQLAIYARSLIEEVQRQIRRFFPGDMLVVMTIHQPRTFEENPTKIWTLTIKELWEFTEDKILPAVKEILWGDNPVFAPSDSVCQFCDIKGVCKARQEFLTEPLPIDPTEVFEKVETTTQDDEGQNFVAKFEAAEYNVEQTLSDEQIAALCLNKGAIEKLLKDVWAYAQSRLEMGHAIEGLKLVMGKPGNRCWANEEDAAKLLRKIPAAKRFNKTLVSVAQAEKLIKSMKIEQTTRFKNRWEQLIKRPAGKPTLAFADDPREALATKPEEVFEQVEDLSEFDPLG